MAIDYDMYSEDWTPADVLAEDATGAKLKEMSDALRQVQAQLKMAMDKGVTPAEFAKGTALLASFEAADNGLRRSWKKRHKN